MLCPPTLTEDNRKCLRSMGLSDEMINEALVVIRARPVAPPQEFAAVRKYYQIEHPDQWERRKNEQ